MNTTNKYTANASGNVKLGQGATFQKPSQKTSPEDIKEYITVLQGGFKGPVPSCCACFRPRSEATTFGHFQQSGHLSASIAEINRTFRERAKLALLKDCFLRLQASKEFVSELEKTTEGYNAFLRERLDSCDDSVRSGFPFKADRFHDICQSAKSQLRHWSTVKQTILAEPWLRGSLPDLLHDLQIIKRGLYQQGKTAVLWIAGILSCVMRIAERCEWRLSHEVLRSIFRGIEDYNRLCEYFKDVTGEVESVFSLDEASFSAHAKLCLLFRGCCNPCGQNENKVCAISLNRLLNGVARQRSYILARYVHKFLCEHDEINRTLNCDFSSIFQWKDSLWSNQTGTQPKNGVVTACSRNQIPLLKIDPEAPFLSFDSEENKFASNLIAQLSNATTLMLGGEKRPLLQTPLSDAPHHDGVKGQSPMVPAQRDIEASHGILKHQSGNVSPRLGKRVQWLAPLDGATKGQLCLEYMAMIWCNFGMTLVQELEEATWKAEQMGRSLGPNPLWSNALMVSAVGLLESLRLSGCLPPVGLQSLQAVSQHIHCQASRSSWDSGYCELLGTSLNDKCHSNGDGLAEECPATSTVQAVTALLQPLNSIFEVTRYWKQRTTWQEPVSSRTPKLSGVSLLPSVFQLQSLLTFCLSWLNTRINYFLSSWSLEPFLLLTQWDLPSLLTSAKKTVKLLQPLCSGQGGENGWNSLQTQFDEVKDTLGKLEDLANTSWARFSERLKSMSTEFFQETMPKGKSWRKSRHAGVPFQYNLYAEHAVSKILAPVVRSTYQLSSDTQLNVLTFTVNTLITCWTDHILTEEIIFSYYGAQQVQLDFNHVKFWISSEESGLCDKIQSSLLSLDVFRHLDGAISLLMLQPRKKKKQSDELDVELESNMSAISSSSVLSSFSGVDLDGYDIDILNDKTIPNSQRWLSLRLRGGKSKKGLLPFCLKAQEMK